MSATSFITCLWFDDQGEDAARYYTGVFRDAKLGRIGYYGESDPGRAGSVMTAEFELNGQRFVALNGGAQPGFVFNESISFQILTADQDETDYYWDALTADGEEGPCGWLKDKYGLSWQVVPSDVLAMLTDSDPEAATRAQQALYSMKKIDIATIAKAHAG
ncbi:MAG: VOC family protein [Streptosporangiales bacterium]|nr:VOC family protein [Streptosporangiales bacterium]